jgi:hypothetical protein
MDEDLADTDDDPTPNLSSSPAAPRRCHRIQIIAGAFTPPKKKFAQKRTYCVIEDSNPTPRLAQTFLLHKPKQAYTKKIYESGLKNPNIKLKPKAAEDRISPSKPLLISCLGA